MSEHDILRDYSIRCPECKGTRLTSDNNGNHKCLDCGEACTDSTAIPSLWRCANLLIGDLVTVIVPLTEVSGKTGKIVGISVQDKEMPFMVEFEDFRQWRFGAKELRLEVPVKKV